MAGQERYGVSLQGLYGRPRRSFPFKDVDSAAKPIVAIISIVGYTKASIQKEKGATFIAPIQSFKVRSYSNQLPYQQHPTLVVCQSSIDRGNVVAPLAGARPSPSVPGPAHQMNVNNPLG